MRSWRRCAWLLPLLLGCGGSPGGADGGDTGALPGGDAVAGDTAGDAGTAGGDARADVPVQDASFAFTATAAVACDGNAPVATCGGAVIVAVGDLAGARLDDATVTANDTPVPSTGSGLYQVRQTGLASTYRFVVTRAGETLSATLASISDYALTLAPATPGANAPATLSWTPSGTPDVEVVVDVMGPRGSLTFHTVVTDTGQVALPAETFPMADTYTVTVLRRVFYYNQPNALPSASPRNIGLTRTLTVTVP